MIESINYILLTVDAVKYSLKLRNSEKKFLKRKGVVSQMEKVKTFIEENQDFFPVAGVSEKEQELNPYF